MADRDLPRRLKQQRSDIDGLSELAAEMRGDLRTPDRKVDGLGGRVDTLDRKVDDGFTAVLAQLAELRRARPDA